MADPLKPDDIVKRPSPNWNERPNFGDTDRPLIDTVVLHYTGMKTGAEAMERLCASDSQVSAHYLVEENGDIFELVAPEKRAWHAGVSSWQGRDNINDTSIGIEVVNPGHEFGYRSFPEKQIERLIDLLRHLKTQFNIPAHRYLGHSDVAPGRKQDPGELFPWQRLAGLGFGLGTRKYTNDATIIAKKGMVSQDVARLNKSLATIGYAVLPDDRFSPETYEALTAFQRHWRPEKVDGQLDRSTQAVVDYIVGKMSLLIK